MSSNTPCTIRTPCTTRASLSRLIPRLLLLALFCTAPAAGCSRLTGIVEPPDDGSGLLMGDYMPGPESIEEQVANAVRGGESILIGTIRVEGETIHPTLHDVMAAEDILDAQRFVLEESGVDVAATFGPEVTPDLEQVREVAEPSVFDAFLNVEEYVGGPYTIYELEVERVLHAAGLPPETTTLRLKGHRERSWQAFQKDDRVLLMGRMDDDDFFEFYGYAENYRLDTAPIEDLTGEPAALAIRQVGEGRGTERLDAPGLIAAVEAAVGPSIAAARATAAAPTATPYPRSIGNLAVVGGVGGGAHDAFNIVAQWQGRLVLGLGARLAVLDIDDPSAPRVIGEGDLLPRVIRGIALDGSVAYAALSDRGVGIVDLSPSAGPETVHVVEKAPASLWRWLCERDICTS